MFLEVGAGSYSIVDEMLNPKACECTHESGGKRGILFTVADKDVDDLHPQSVCVEWNATGTDTLLPSFFLGYAGAVTANSILKTYAASDPHRCLRIGGVDEVKDLQPL